MCRKIKAVQEIRVINQYHVVTADNKLTTNDPHYQVTLN